MNYLVWGERGCIVYCNYLCHSLSVLLSQYKPFVHVGKGLQFKYQVVSLPAHEEFYFPLDVVYIQSSFFFFAAILPQGRELNTEFLCKASSTSQLLKAGPLEFFVLQFLRLLKCAIFMIY